jgi:hypothetical protein
MCATKHHSPAPNMGAGWGGGSERWLSRTEARLPLPNLPDVGGGDFSACSAYATALPRVADYRRDACAACAISQSRSVVASALSGRWALQLT